MKGLVVISDPFLLSSFYLLNTYNMKTLDQFDFNGQYPMHVGGETLYNREQYAEFLIRKGYAINPKEDISNRLDVIEDKIKSEFSNPKRGRKNKEVNE